MTAPATAPCRTNQMSARPTARTAEFAASALVTASVLPGPGAPIHGPPTRQPSANLTKFSGRRTTALERLQDQLPGRAAERAVEQIGDKSPLRDRFGVARTIDVLPTLRGTHGEPLLGHRLERFQRGRV